MPLRLIEVVVPSAATPRVAALFDEQFLLGSWNERLADEIDLIRFLVPAERANQLLDELEGRFSAEPGFRVMLFSVEATLPRPAEPEQEKESDSEEQPPPNPNQVSREELYAQISECARMTPVYLTTVVLATFVAMVGLLRNETAAIIGAMVLAPLLGPNVALALATTLGDLKLGWGALRTAVAGFVLCFLLSLIIGLAFPADPEIPALASRTRVGLGDVVIALSAGIAGGLAFTTAAPASLVGVMVAVSLLPPLVVCGLLFGAGHHQQAFGALALVTTNVICVNLAGVVTFLALGVRPRTWWESNRARTATRIAVTIWIVLLLCLVLLHSGWFFELSYHRR
jgi:uncharacterized hydrophobic protein (TIGR00341 family)